ncbi:septal ring lytic transglycosylase RlpA family protein [Avibacterium sp. 21-595]|uniref:septal ring lytic transglycosylase RlpA family protein n=1 Tax=unclassified Avibacterium TaxID=2685287 RepID=UPI002026674B|nr:septal ring lytic transglycosylase RlpA family protein [Avibacterium sp. 21-595]URL02478.1 septal ring lytic transglycosylase RlpA family protein [Avibacterium sp. 20-126]URL07145.1 septal ring lytic transglycosylase RlpA family protein [Avibacterium sp. 21-595]
MKLIPVIRLSMAFLLLLANVNGYAETQKLYGVKGPNLIHQKMADKTYTYVVNGVSYTTKHPSTAKHYSKTGGASYYHQKFSGRKTSNGEYYDPNRYTAAHKTLPLNSYALVTNLRNGRKVIVKINDRGPFVKGRIIDLSRVAAKELGIIHRGVGQVRVEALHVSAKGKILGAGTHTLAKMAKTPEAKKRLDLSPKQSAVLSETNFSGYHVKMLNLTYKQAIQMVKQAKRLKVKTKISSNKQSHSILFGPFKTKSEAQQLKAKLHKLNGTKPLIIYHQK